MMEARLLGILCAKGWLSSKCMQSIFSSESEAQLRSGTVTIYTRIQYLNLFHGMLDIYIYIVNRHIHILSLGVYVR